MSRKINSFSEFLNEASLRGNIGIPGEEGSDRESWLDKITARSNVAAREFFNQNQADIRNFMGLVDRSIELQAGHEEELSQLTVDAFTKIFGSLLEDITLDLKIVTKSEIKSEMEETPTEKSEENTELEELEDQEIIDQVHKRKILRTIQQGKGLNSKAILNLSLFKDGLVEILGPQDAAEYLTVLNKISNVAQFFDWDMPEDVQKQMWQTRQGFSGSCDIEFDKDEAKEKEDEAQKVLDDLAKGDDVTDNENVEELIDGLNVRIVARGVDLSVLIHESIKGIYKLITQASLEALYGGSAEKVLMNTDTLFDELQEIKFGRQMQNAFFKIVREHPLVTARMNQLLAEDLPDWQVASFQERLDYLFFNEIAQLGQEEAKEMLDVVNAILSESPETNDLCEPFIRKAIKSIDQEEEYQAWKRGERAEPVNFEEEPEFEMPTAKPRAETMTQDEINDAIIDAYSRGDMAEVARLEKLLK